MGVGDTFQGQLVTKQPHELAPGEYMFRTDSDTRMLSWYACTPNGLLGNLDGHEVTVHDDGTITVAPSILVSNGKAGDKWHGYLEQGVWREV